MNRRSYSHSGDIDAIAAIPDHSGFFLVATYDLAKDTALSDSREQGKGGTITVLHVQDDSFRSDKPHELSNGIYDLVFHPTCKDIFATAQSKCSIGVHLLCWDAEKEFPAIISLPTISISQSEDENRATVTSLAFLVDANPTTTFLALTLTTGTIRIVCIDLPFPPLLCELSPSSLQEVTLPLLSTTDIHAHAESAWICTSYPLPEETLLFSGGDDAALMVTHISACDDENVTTTNSRIHGAGVTALLILRPRSGTSDADEIPVLTGCYDETIRLLLYSPTTRRFKLAAEVSAGPAWRFSLMKQWTTLKGDVEHSLILAACQRRGTKVLRIERRRDVGNWAISEVAAFEAGAEGTAEDERSLVYGASFTERSGRVGEYLVVAGGMYDRQINAWDWMADEAG